VRLRREEAERPVLAGLEQGPLAIMPRPGGKGGVEVEVDLPYPFQAVDDGLLLDPQLPGIVDELEVAAAAFSENGTAGLDPVRRRGVDAAHDGVP
jgi:hypothetical protein